MEIAWKIFVKTFFFLESTCACVLGPWPWPRAFLSLASRVFVLGKAVLGLGLGFFFVSLALTSSLVSSTPPLLQQTKQKRSYFYLTIINFQFAWHPIIEPSAIASTRKNIPGLILFDQSRTIMQILVVIDDIAWKKLCYTLKGSTQAKLFWHFPFIYFISVQAEKKS